MTKKQGQDLNSLFMDILAPNAVSQEVLQNNKMSIYEQNERVLSKSKSKKLNESIIDILSSNKIK